MKPWHAQPDSRSDFAATATDAPPSVAATSATLALARGVGTLGAATFLLAFTEACLHLEQRPIPLRFAARYAAVNVIPSAVWKTVPVQYVAAASNLPAARLVTAAAPHGEPNLAMAPRRANRLIAIQSLRSVRYAVASYGLAWTLLRWHETQQAAVGEDSASSPIPAGQAERVVRLTPAGSSLSMATAEKHGAHVVQIPWRDFRRGDPIDWSTIRLDESWRKDDDRGGASGSGVKVLELEIDGDHEDAAALMVAKRAASGAGGGVRTVALVDAAAAPVCHGRGNGVDVYFFVLSGVVRFLSDHCNVGNDKRLVLVTSREDEEHASERSQRLLRFVSRAMVHRIGVPTSVGLHHLSDDEHEDEDHDEKLDAPSEPPATVAVFAASVAGAVEQVNEIIRSGHSTLSRIVVIVDQTASTLPDPLPSCAGVLSVADLSDSVLQRIRVQLRAGVSPEAIQHTIFDEFGEQSALLHRADSASDTAKYI